MELLRYLRKASFYQKDSIEAFIYNGGVGWKAFQICKKHIEMHHKEVSSYFKSCIIFADIIYSKFIIKNDPNLIAAALLYLFVKDKEIPVKEVHKEFGDDITSLIKNALACNHSIDSLRRNVEIKDIDPRSGIIIMADHIFYFFNRLGKLEEYSPMAHLPLREKDILIVNLYERYMVQKLQSIIDQEGIDAKIGTRKFGYIGIKNTKDFHKFSPTGLISFRIIFNDHNKKFKSSDCIVMWGDLLSVFTYNVDKEWTDDFFDRPKRNGYSAYQIGLKYPFDNVEIAITTISKEKENKKLFFGSRFK
jgi:(p)ppGpp synthase/HD superfamily hydrolase